MGQSIKKLTHNGIDEKKAKEIEPIIEEYYMTYFADTDKDWTMADFYRAVCQIVEGLNKKIGGTQFRVPSKEVLEKAFKDHHGGQGKSLTREEFGKILKDVIFDTGILGSGGKDILFYIFGVPMTTFMIKQKLAPKAIPNELFIPGVTSATVFVLAKLNKI